MCYNRRAVKRVASEGPALVPSEPRGVISAQVAPVQNDLSAAAEKLEGISLAPNDHASRYCPLCSQRLESRRCKLICPVCGYYMSCADYY
jgi:rubrerythrin